MWTVGLTVEIKLRFQISPVSYGRGISYQISFNSATKIQGNKADFFIDHPTMVVYIFSLRTTQSLYFIFSSEPDCDLDIERIGCFKDRKEPRLLPEYIMTDREKKLAIYSGQSIDWRNWDVYLPGFVCRCAKAAKERGYNTFGVQYYGTCKEHCEQSSWLL